MQMHSTTILVSRAIRIIGLLFISAFKSATSSSFLSNDQDTWKPDLAIDGKVSAANLGYFHSTAEADPWMRVDLVNPMIITQAVLAELNCAISSQ